MARNATYSTFLVKQRAFLKIYLISMAEKEKLYGLQFQHQLRNEFKKYNYQPTHSEIYKSLHELLESGILKRNKTIQEGKKLQEVAFYTINDEQKASHYKDLLQSELNRCYNLIGKAIEDIYT